MSSSRESARASAAQQTLDSKQRSLLNVTTHIYVLDRETLATCVSMIESGVNPEALATVIKELRREAATLNAQATSPR
ncbi:mitotic-spindle organizing [Ceratobasidium sp. AG-Ba]|nr:mitotic-spindle organizing [Ceratobasidium sp. AG-Ba]QRW04055.1 mitotic-spindle organizing [Ceratobasidium sp. AG-Ba]